MTTFKETNSLLKSVDSFNGSSKNIKLDLDRFLNHAEMIWENLDDGEEPRRLFMRLIKNKLYDKAYEIVRYNDFKEWSELKQALQSKFVIRRSQGVVASELVNISQSKTTDIRTFASKVEGLLNELNEICIEEQGKDAAKIINEYNERMALNAFQNGINNPFMKTIVKSHDFDKLSNAIEKAIDEEILHIPIKSSNKLCTFCNKTGHLEERCYKKKNNAKNQKSSVDNKSLEPNYPNGSTKIHCEFCNKAGHVVQNCYKKIIKSYSIRIQIRR